MACSCLTSRPRPMENTVLDDHDRRAPINYIIIIIWEETRHKSAVTCFRQSYATATMTATRRFRKSVKASRAHVDVRIAGRGKCTKSDWDHRKYVDPIHRDWSLGEPTATTTRRRFFPRACRRRSVEPSAHRRLARRIDNVFRTPDTSSARPGLLTVFVRFESM